MDCLPDAILQYIISHLTNAKDVATCACVSKRWKESTSFIRSLYFQRNAFESKDTTMNADYAVWKMVSSVARLEELVVYCPFSTQGLVSWLSSSCSSLRHLELRMDTLNEDPESSGLKKLDYIQSAHRLESLKLWGVRMDVSPNWELFPNLKTLEIVGAKIKDPVLSQVLQACPNLTVLLLLGCEGDGVMSVSIELNHLEHCKLDFYGSGNSLLSIACPKLISLAVHGCSWIRASRTECLKHLFIANNGERVYMVDFGKLSALESLDLRGVQWCWHALSQMLQMASEVKQLFMKVEFTGETNSLLPFPEIDFVDFFNSHPKLQKFEIHGAMFAALCHTSSLDMANLKFTIPCLEEVVITVRSPLNAEQKMNTLESLLRYSNNLKRMAIKILQMKSSHSSADEFFEEVCKFAFVNRKIVSIE